jgi:hypothetical protein
MTKKMIKIFIIRYNKWFDLELSPSSLIAISYQAADISELENRRSDISNSIKIPRTANNNMAFDFIGNIKLASKLPYRRIACRLVIDGICLSAGYTDAENNQHGSFVEVDSIDDNYINVHIYSGNYDLFSIAKQKKLCDLDFKSESEIVWDKSNMINKTAENIVFPIIDYSANDDGSPCIIYDGKNGNLNANANYLYPGIRLPCLIETICNNAGYKFESDIQSGGKYRNAAVMCVSQKAGVLANNLWQASYNGSGTISQMHYDDFRFGNYGSFNGNAVLFDDSESCRLKYHCPYTGVYSAKIDYRLKTDNELVYLRCKFYKTNAGGQQESLYIYTPYIRNTEYETPNASDFTTIRCVKGDIIAIEFEIFVPQGLTGTHVIVDKISIEMYALNDAQTEYGQTYNIAVNLPDMTQADLLKAFMQMFGLVGYLDVKRKIFRANTFDKIFENRYKPGTAIAAKDWSAKIDDRAASVSFNFKSFAKINRIKYRDSESTDDFGRSMKTENSGFFISDNDKLDAEKTLFDLPFTALEETTHHYPMAKIRYRSDDGTANNNSIEACIVYLKQVNGISLNDDYGYVTGEANIATFGELGAQKLIDNYYGGLQNNILKRCRVYELQALLSAADVANFDHTIPVWIDKYKSFFYVNRIRNHQQGKLTKIELVMMQ